MICPKCNTKNNYYHTYCYQCGEKLPEQENPSAEEASEAVSATNIVITEHPQEKKKRQQKKDLRKRLILLLAAVVLIAILVFVFQYLSGQVKFKAASLPSYVPVTAAPAPSPTPKTAVSFTIDSPAEQPFETDQERYTVRVSAPAGSSVSIDGEPAAASGEGAWSCEVSLHMGENKIPVEAQCEGFLPSAQILTINRIEPAARLSIEAGSAVQTEEGQLTVTGTTEPGATLTPSLPLVGEALVDAQGAFTLTVQLPISPGDYTLTLKASVQGMRESSVDFPVKRPLNEQQYADAAEAVSFSEFMQNPESYRGKILELTGTVEEIIDPTTGNLTFTMLYRGRASQRIRVTYSGETPIELRSTRRILCEYIRMEDGVPVFLARMAFRVNAQ